jgi:hypothetical protein
MTTLSTLKRAALALALAGSTIIAGMGASTALHTAHAATLTAYVGRLLFDKGVVLGPQSNPTLVVQTPALPAGNYLVNATVSAVIASHDQIVCSVSPSAGGGGNYVFGTAGNGSGTAGDGIGIYGTAPIADVVTVKTAGATLQVMCNSFNVGKGGVSGTAVSTAQITALPVDAVSAADS